MKLKKKVSVDSCQCSSNTSNERYVESKTSVPSTPKRSTTSKKSSKLTPSQTPTPSQTSKKSSTSSKQKLTRSRSRSSAASVDDYSEKCNSALGGNCGTPMVVLPWRTIWKIVILCVVANGVIMLYASLLMIFGIHTQKSIGDFLNMVSEGDGTAIPICLILAGFFSLPLSAAFIFVTWKSCSNSRNLVVNSIHFMLIIVAICMVAMLVVLAIFCVIHAYSSMKHRLHSGIIDAMMAYNSTPATKTRIDILQITFECCGSKSYSEWFDIAWFDTTNAATEGDQTIRDDAPFSCCSRHSRYPCIHHDLMSVGSSYLYAPETNLSVSEHGCYPVLLRQVRAVAWRAFHALLFLALLLVGVAIAQRFLQTAHTEMYRYERNSHWHTAWLFGCYKSRRGKVPPKPPPIPAELMR